MKYYNLDAFINNNKKIHKSFVTRDDANAYLDKLVYKYNCEVQEVINRNKHEYEYICTPATRITINRHVIA